MTTYTMNSTAPLGSITVYRVVSFVGNFGENLQAWNAARKTRNVLRKLSDAQLNDIGLTYGEIAGITEQRIR